LLPGLACVALVLHCFLGWHTPPYGEPNNANWISNTAIARICSVRFLLVYGDVLVSWPLLTCKNCMVVVDEDVGGRVIEKKSRRFDGYSNYVHDG